MMNRNVAAACVGVILLAGCSSNGTTGPTETAAATESPSTTDAAQAELTSAETSDPAPGFKADGTLTDASVEANEAAVAQLVEDTEATLVGIDTTLGGFYSQFDMVAGASHTQTDFRYVYEFAQWEDWEAFALDPLSALAYVDIESTAVEQIFPSMDSYGIIGDLSATWLYGSDSEARLAETGEKANLYVGIRILQDHTTGETVTLTCTTFSIYLAPECS